MVTQKSSPRPARSKKSPRKKAAEAAVAIAPADVLPAALPDDVIDAIAVEINGLARFSVLDLARDVGTVLVTRFYDGKLDAWRSRGAKDASFRKLAAKADKGELSVSAAGLYRAVALVELESRLGVSTWKHLSMSHVRLVFGLPEAVQRTILLEADEDGWTVERIQKEADKVRAHDGRGRKPDPAFVKSIRRLGKLLADDGGWFDDLDKVEGLDAEEVEALWKTVTGMKLKCEELQKRLAVRVPGFGRE